MSNTKKRKSDVNIDTCGTSSSDPKKDRPWFHDDPFNIQPSNDAKSSRRKSFLGNMLHKLKPSKDSHKSMSKLESLNHSDAHSSINSESSITSTESSKIPNIEKNAGLRTFVNRDSFTPVPPIDDKNEDALSTSSKMSVETADSFNLNDAMCHNATTSVFCTPSRTLNRNSNSRISTRSVPDHHVFQDSDESSANMFNSLCNSVRRAPSTKSEGGGVNSMFGSQAMRRSGRLQFNRRHMNASNMEDVPEEEPLASVTPAQTLCNEDGDEEVFVNGKEFFADNTTESNDTNQRTSIDSSRLSIASEHRKTPGSVGRNNSILRKILPSKWNQKERRTSELGDEAVREANDRRLSIISFGAEENNGIDMTNNSEKIVKMRKKTTSSSNLTQRLSSVFRRGSNNSAVMKDDDMSCINKSSNRRSTLTGYSSISSGIGSIASEVSEFGSFGGTIGRSASVSRNGSKRETDKERTRRFLKNVVISDIPAEELLKMKVEQLKRRKDRSIDEEFETQLDETGSSTSSTIQELLNFDVVALDINVDGTPYSKVGEVMINAEISKKIKDEMRSGYRSDKCGTIVECDPDIVFVCSSTAQNKVNTSFAVRDLDESVVSRASVTQSVLVNVRNSISKSIELWNSQALSRTSSTLLLFPMFCSSEEEWDAKDTIEAIYCMLDAMLNTKRWKTNGRVILAGLTSNNVRLLREKYNEMKLSIIDDCELPENESSISNTSVLVTKV